MSSQSHSGFKKLTEEEVERNKTLEEEMFPEGVKNAGGSPELTVQAINWNRDEYVRNSKSLAKLVSKARDIKTWMIDDMHKALNPKNVGQLEVTLTENPNFDPSKKATGSKSDPCSGSNPFFIRTYQHKFNPSKYNTTTVINTVNSLMKDNGDFMKELKAVSEKYERECREREDELRQARIDAGAASKDIVNLESVISLDFDEDDMTVN